MELHSYNNVVAEHKKFYDDRPHMTSDLDFSNPQAVEQWRKDIQTLRRNYYTPVELDTAVQFPVD